MAVTAYMRRRGKWLLPADGLSERDVAELPEDKRVKCVITTPRSVPAHRLYWAIMSAVASNFDVEPDNLHIWVKMELGVVKRLRMKGEDVVVPGSISFASMDGNEFDRFLNRALALLSERTGTDVMALRKAGEELMG